MVKFRWETRLTETYVGEIPNDWAFMEIGKVILRAKNGGTPPTRDKAYWNGDIPWITSNHLDGVFVTQGERFVTRKAIDEQKTALAKKGSLLVATRVGIGKVSIAKCDLAFNQDVTALQIDTKSAKSEYLVRVLRSETYNELLQTIASGTTVDGILREDLLGLHVPLPQPPEQECIASVLSWFDDLIENKRRQNEVLEKVAMAVFKSWFVDFEPFQNGEFVQSELGEIPKGWKVGRLIDVSEIIMGQSPPSKYYNEDGEGLPFIQGKGQFGKYTPEITIYCSGEGKTAKPYDILVTVRAPVGELNIADEEYIIGRGVASLRSEYWSFIFSWLKQNNELIKAYERGTTFDAITKQELESFPILLPPTPILETFHLKMQPLFQKILLNQRQIMILKSIRDTLLPLLVFGRLRVEEI